MKALFPVLCISTIAHAQTLHWAQGYGGPGSDRGHAIAVDAGGNTLLTGSFTDNFEFGAGSGITLTSGGGTDIFIAKVGPDGTLAWASGIGGAWNDSGNDIATDAQGNIYVTGTFRGASVDFDPGPDLVPVSSGSSGNDIFVCKFTPAGTLVWVHAFGGNPADDSGSGITVDDEGNLFMTGVFNGTVDFDSGPDDHSLTSYLWDAFALSLDSAGTYRWAVCFTGSSSDVGGHDIASDQEGNVFVAGEYLADIDLDPGPDTVLVVNAGPSTDAFLCKLDSLGNYIWSATLVSGAGMDALYALAVDAQGNIHGAGEFNGDPLTFSTPSDTIIIAYEGATDAFVMKLDSDGTLVWAKALAGPGGQAATSVAVDQSGYVYTTGLVTSGSTTDFDPGPAPYELSVSNNSLFLSVLNSAGDFECAMTTTSPGGWDEAEDIVLDGDGDIHMTGWFNGTTDFDLNTGGTAELQTAGSDDIFLLKMASSCSIILSAADLPEATLVVVPNPAQDALLVQIVGPANNNVLQVFDLTGKQVLAQTTVGSATTLDVSGLAPGVYMIKPALGTTPTRFVKQ